MAAGASIGELLFVPARLLRIDPSQHTAVCQLGLRVEHRELAIAFLFQKANSMPASHEVLDLGCRARKRCLTLKNVFEFGSILGLTHRNAMRIFLPSWTDVIPMTKQTFVAMYKLWNGLSNVVPSPSRGIELLLGLQNIGGRPLPGCVETYEWESKGQQRCEFYPSCGGCVRLTRTRSRPEKAIKRWDFLHGPEHLSFPRGRGLARPRENLDR